MGFSTWITYGYGICTDEITTTVERLEELLKAAPEYAKKIQEHFAKLEDDFNKCKESEDEKFELMVEDYEEFDQEFLCGIATILKEVIEEAEGIRMTAVENYDSQKYLIFGVEYPWRMNEKEKSFTEEDVENLIRKYVSILTDEAIDIDYQSVENGC